MRTAATIYQAVARLVYGGSEGRFCSARPPANDDAQVIWEVLIWEVLNVRQTPLSAIDLVKNLLFLRGEMAENDDENICDLYWAQFDDE